MRYLQRLVHSKPSIQYENALKLKLKSTITNKIKPYIIDAKEEIEFDYEDNEALFLERMPSV